MEDNRTDEVPSASVISGCLRQFALKRRVPYYERPQDLLPSVFGTAFHLLMEKYTEHDPGVPGDIEDYGPGGRVTYLPDTPPGPRHKELHLKTYLDLGIAGYTAVQMQGRCDYLHEGEVLRDWKSKKFLPVGFAAPDEHFKQANIYNWLAEKNGYKPAPRIEIAYVSQSWVHTVWRPAEPLLTISRYVHDRLRVWASAEVQGGLPYPVPEFFDLDGKTKPPCSYCPVREACMQAWRDEGEAPF